MDVAPHPHIGLQTVTWLHSGEVLHNDSLGSECLIRPGQLSLMTAGRGIAHTEQTPRKNSGQLEGIQFWVALPQAARDLAPHYQCIEQQPRLEVPGGTLTHILGGPSQGTLYSPATGIDLRIHPHSEIELPLEAAFEYGLLLVHGDASFKDGPLTEGSLYYLEPGSTQLSLATIGGAKLILIGGAPFGERIVMWWNFVARTSEEIEAAKKAWDLRERFGEVPGYDGPRLSAPDLLGRVLPRD